MLRQGPWSRSAAVDEVLDSCIGRPSPACSVASPRSGRTSGRPPGGDGGVSSHPSPACLGWEDRRLIHSIPPRTLQRAAIAAIRRTLHTKCCPAAQGAISIETRLACLAMIRTNVLDFGRVGAFGGCRMRTRRYGRRQSSVAGLRRGGVPATGGRAGRQHRGLKCPHAPTGIVVVGRVPQPVVSPWQLCLQKIQDELHPGARSHPGPPRHKATRAPLRRRRLGRQAASAASQRHRLARRRRVRRQHRRLRPPIRRTSITVIVVAAHKPHKSADKRVAQRFFADGLEEVRRGWSATSSPLRHPVRQGLITSNRSRRPAARSPSCDTRSSTTWTSRFGDSTLLFLPGMQHQEPSCVRGRLSL